MSAVQIERGPNGYAVTRCFRNLPAALRAAQAVMEVAEAGFEPVLNPATIVLDPTTTKLAEMQARAEADDPEPHDGRPLNLPSKDEE